MVRKAVRPVVAVVGVGMFCLLWELAASISSSTKIPSISAVLSAVRADWSAIPAVTYVYYRNVAIGSGLLYTAENVLVGVGIGFALGLPLGLALARGRSLRALLEPSLLVVGTVPLLIVLPFLSFWFGTSRLAQSGLVIIFALLTIAFATKGAAMAVGSSHCEFAACLGASPNRIVRTVVLPASVPVIVGAVRLAFGLGWGLEVVAEQLGAKSGLGLVIQTTGGLAATSDLLATVLCLVVAALLLDGMVVILSRLMIRWPE